MPPPDLTSDLLVTPRCTLMSSGPSLVQESGHLLVLQSWDTA